MAAGTAALKAEPASHTAAGPPLVATPLAGCHAHTPCVPAPQSIEQSSPPKPSKQAHTFGPVQTPLKLQLLGHVKYEQPSPP